MWISQRVQCARLFDINNRKMEEISRDLDALAGALLTYFSKPFDCIYHELRIAKIYAYAFDNNSLYFIHSYLSQIK